MNMIINFVKELLETYNNALHTVGQTMNMSLSEAGTYLCENLTVLQLLMLIMAAIIAIDVARSLVLGTRKGFKLVSAIKWPTPPTTSALEEAGSQAIRFESHVPKGTLKIQ